MKQINQQDGERGFVHLQTAPIGPAVKPHVLWPAPVAFLSGLEISQYAHCVAYRTCGEKTTGGFDQIAGPDQVIAAKIFISLVESPWDRKAGDHAACKIFGLMKAQHRCA